MAITTTTATGLADLKALSTSNLSVVYAGSLWTWTPGNYSGQADDVNIVKANSTALTVGAWVRQRADGMTFHQVGAGAVSRTTMEKMRENVSLRDFGADPTGGTSAVTAFNAALAAARRVEGMPGDTYLLDGQVVVPADREIIGNGATIKLVRGGIGLRLPNDRCKVLNWTLVGNSGLYAVLNEGRFNEFSNNFCTGNIGHYFFSTGAENVRATGNKIDGLTADTEITTAIVTENCRHVAITGNQFFNVPQGWSIQTRETENFVISDNTIFHKQYSDTIISTTDQAVYNFDIGAIALIDTVAEPSRPKVRVQINGKPLSPTNPNGTVNYTIGGSGPNYTVTFTAGRIAGERLKLIGYRGAENIQINNNSRYGIIANNAIDGTGDAGIIALGSHLSITGNKVQHTGYAGIAIYGGVDNISVVGNTIIDCAQMDDGRSSPDNPVFSSPFAGGLFIAGENIAVTGNNFINDSGTMTYGVMIQKTNMTLKFDGSAAITIGDNQFRGEFASGRIYIPNQDPGFRANSIQIDGALISYPRQVDLEASWVESATGSAAQGRFQPAGNFAITVDGSSGIRAVRNTSETVDGGVSLQTVPGEYVDFIYTRAGMLKDSVVTVQWWARNVGGNSYAHVVTKLLGLDAALEVPITDPAWRLYTVRIPLSDQLDPFLRIRFGGNFGAAVIQHVQIAGNRL